jgi:hypothetical protein
MSTEARSAKVEESERGPRDNRSFRMLGFLPDISRHLSL